MTNDTADQWPDDDPSWRSAELERMLVRARLVDNPQVPTDIVDVPRETSAIAYTVGSLWFCLTCGPRIKGATPEPGGNTFDCYRYDCDQCGKAILPARDVPRETSEDGST